MPMLRLGRSTRLAAARRTTACQTWWAWLPATLCAAIFSVPLLAATGPPVKKDFYLEAQPLANALAAWSAQSGVLYVCYLDPSAFPQASAVIGRFTPEQALRRLLPGTGLTYSMKEGMVVIRYEKKKPDATPVPNPKGPSPPPKPRSEDSQIPTKLDEVVVTGTKIPGGRPVGSPVLRLSDTQISNIGHPTLEQVLQALPEFTRESADSRLSLGPRASGNITFASAANLRALGSAATLTLLNNRRMALSGQGVADLSAIPIAAISHVEILKDGASAAYGTDAVAGVVNIFLKEEHDQNETRARYAVTTRAGRQEVSASQTLGATGDRGSIVGVADYLNQTALSVNERLRTRDVPWPENIAPSNKQLSAYLAGRYELADAWQLRVQGLHARIERLAFGAMADGHLEFPVSMHRTHGALSAHYEGEQGWTVAITGYRSGEETDFSFLSYSPGSHAWDAERSQVQHLSQDLWAVNVEASRAIRVLPALELALAIGTEHREEAYRRQLRSPTQQSEDVARTVDSAYLELQLPIGGEQNGRAGAEGVRLSFASRYDTYSDVGSINNPKFGIAWMPVQGIEARASLGWSLRAPTVGEELSSAARGSERRVSIYSFASAEGPGRQPVTLLSGSTQLRAETARHWTAGFTVYPKIFEGWTFEVTYFDVDYTDRIVAAPFDANALRNPDLQSFIRTYATPAQLQAALASEIGGELEYADRTGAGYGGGEFGLRPQDASTVVYDSRLTNASILRTNGVDVGVSYSAGELQTGRWQFVLAATWTDAIETVFAPGARAVDLVGTTGYPARWKFLATAALEREEGWSAAFALRVTDSYTDTSSTVHHRVRSSMTADARLTYTFSPRDTPVLANVSISLALANLSDERPPYITGSDANRHAHYDTALAEPVGRLASLDIRKRW